MSSQSDSPLSQSIFQIFKEISWKTTDLAKLLVKIWQPLSKTHQKYLFPQITYERGFTHPKTLCQSETYFGHQGRKTYFLKRAFFRNMKITVTSVSGKGFLNTQADRGSDSGDFLFFTRVSTMNVAVFIVKILNLYFCEWPSA